MNNVYQIGSGDLTFDLIERILTENLKLELAPAAKERIQRCRDYLDRKIAQSDVPLYGITTGFGSLCNKNISADELGTLQENLTTTAARWARRATWPRWPTSSCPSSAWATSITKAGSARPSACWTSSAGSLSA